MRGRSIVSEELKNDSTLTEGRHLRGGGTRKARGNVTWSETPIGMQAMKAREDHRVDFLGKLGRHGEGHKRKARETKLMSIAGPRSPSSRKGQMLSLGNEEATQRITRRQRDRGVPFSIGGVDRKGQD